MIRLSHIAFLAGILALPFTAQAASARDIDPYTTSCAVNIESMGKYSIDGAVTLISLVPAPDGKALLVNNDTMMAYAATPETLASIRKSKTPAWLAMRFKPTVDAVAGYLNGSRYDILSGFVVNLVIAYKGGCVVLSEAPEDIQKYPSLVLTNVYLNHKLVQPDGSYKMMTPEIIQRIMAKTDAEKLYELRSTLKGRMANKYGDMLKRATD